MNTENEVNQMLIEALGGIVDPILLKRDFKRNKKSIDYVRTCKDCEQVLRMSFEYRPDYQPGAECRIYPRVRFVFPIINRLALEMINNELSLIGGDSSITFSEPIDIVIPKKYHVRWFVFNPEDISNCLRSINFAIENWVVPFLDEYRTIDSLMAAHERQDERFLWQRHSYIYVAAAYLLAGQTSNAMSVLNNKLGKAKSRRQYAKAFEFVAARCPRSNSHRNDS